MSALAAGSPSPSKRAKIWRRTLVGGGLALALTALLWTVHATQSNALVLAVGVLFAALCVYEGSRLGSYKSLRLQAPLWVAWFVGVAMAASVGERGLGTTSICVFFCGAFVSLGLAGLDHRSRGPTERCVGVLLLTCAGVLVAQAVRTALVRTEWPSFHRVIDAWQGAVFGATFVGLLALAFAANASQRLHLARVSGWMSVWLVLPFTWLHYVEADWHVAGLIALAILSKIGDTAGYYFGNAFGKHHPFQTISPGKTTEGCLASLAAGIAAGVALVHFGLLPSAPFGLLGGAAVGAVTNIAAQAGDLFESWVKRKAGVKDSGTWFGPSGGVLDLVDSFLFTIPAALLVWPMLLEVPIRAAR
jgi:CDP-diglyceride synthetase